MSLDREGDNERWVGAARAATQRPVWAQADDCPDRAR